MKQGKRKRHRYNYETGDFVITVADATDFTLSSSVRDMLDKLIVEIVTRTVVKGMKQSGEMNE